MENTHNSSINTDAPEKNTQLKDDFWKHPKTVKPLMIFLAVLGAVCAVWMPALALIEASAIMGLGAANEDKGIRRLGFVLSTVVIILAAVFFVCLKVLKLYDI